MPSPSLPAAGLRRDVDLLEALASAEAVQHNGLGVLRVAALVGREKSQVSRALAALAEEGLVDRDPDDRSYRLGSRLYALAARTAEARLATLATPHLRRLVTVVHETVHLCVLRGGEVLTIQSEAPAHAFRGLGWEGVSVPAPLTSAGRVLMSDWEPDVVRAWLTPETAAALGARPGARVRLHSVDDLLSELAGIRRRGYALVDEEFEVGLVGCSAPVRDFHGRIVAAINVSAPKGRLGPHLDRAGALTMGAADQLSLALAGRTRSA